MLARTLQMGALFAFLSLHMTGCTEPESTGGAEVMAEETEVMADEAELTFEDIEVISDTRVAGFRFPEAVAYDPTANALYVSEFVSALEPTQKDGQGRISKVSLDGTVMVRRFLPAEGQALNKPKGMWVAGDRLWVTDIDSLWVFDTGTRRGKRVVLPESQFANDVTVIGEAAYVSDNRGDRLYRVAPADFLGMADDPEVTVLAEEAGINPNGLFPAPGDWLLMAGFKSAEDARGIYGRSPRGEVRIFADDLGRVDGIYLMENGTVLVTEWNSGLLGLWDGSMGFRELASGFDGPADFGVVPNADGLLAVVPDLVKSELRLIQLGRAGGNAE